MKVELIAHTPNPDLVCATAAQSCMWHNIPKGGNVAKGSLKHALASGHESVAEHASFTFAIEGVSRALTHQLVRHRMASYSQQSQRYVKMGGFDYVIPESIKAASETELMNGGGWHTNGCIHDALDHYRIILDDLIKRLRDAGVPEEDIRYFYPNVSYSPQSQRYVKMDGSDYVIPESIKNHEKTWDEDGKTDIEKWYRNTMEGLSEFYAELIEAGIPEEDARYILPNACTTNIVVTMNARELRHFFRLRCCTRAQWEIRELANEMLRLVKEVAPMLFKDAGASCVATGRCPEGKKSCGRVKE